MIKNIFILSFCLFSMVVSPVFAHGDDDHDHSKEDKAKIELATKLNAAWGVKDQASVVIDLMANEIPSVQREAFRAYIAKVIDLDKIDKISIDASVEVFTEAELRAMLAYYSQDVVKSAEKKRAEYNNIVAPQIKDMIDKGMVEATGELQRLKSIQ